MHFIHYTYVCQRYWEPVFAEVSVLMAVDVVPSVLVVRSGVEVAFAEKNQ